MMRWWWFGPAVTKPELQRELEQMKAEGMAMRISSEILISLMAFVVGGVAVKAPIVEPHAQDSNKEMSDRIPEKASTSSWNRPVFTGNPGNMGSLYVPLDSWIYPAFDRLIALG